MTNGGVKNNLSAINRLIVVFVFANIVIIGLTVLNYLRDGDFNATSIIVGATVLVSAVLIKVLLENKVKAAADERRKR